MSDAIAVVELNKGMDQVSPPLTAESGALLDCLNYEMTDIAGYRRIDGYERYDGYPNGAIYEYYNIVLTAADSPNQSSIVAGSIISRTGTTVPSVDIGVVLSSGALVDGLWYYDVAPFNNITQFILTEEFLTLSDSESFMELSDGDSLLKILGDGSTLGDTFTVTTPGGASFEITIGSTPVAGRTLATPEEYLTNIRSYSAILRGLVQDTPSTIAGLYWFEDRLLVALNTLEIEVSVATGLPAPTIGTLMRWAGTQYRVIRVELVSSDASDVYLLSLATVGDALATDDDLVEVQVDGTTIDVWIMDVTANGDASSTASKYAQMAYCNNPTISTTRGYTYLTPATNFAFDAGDYSGTLAPPLTLEDGTDPADAYYVVGDAGATVMKVRLSEVTQQGGTWSSGNATGTAQVVVIESVSGVRDYLSDNDEIHTAYPTGVDTRVFTVNGTCTISVLAGTATLDTAGTRYVWNTYNFYGQSSTLSAYGCTGATRSFWANENGYGTITAIASEDLDKPKYLAFHVGKLALGYSKGSVLLSVAGEPHNFEGSQGAIEIATGDSITGLLELPGDTLGVFGRRSIRKINGYTDADTVLGTLVARSSCFDYTACAVGQDAVFTGVHGITTLQQSNVYGDFEGENVSDSVSTWLRPKLVRNRPGFEVGGVICAFPVRSKAQYRLVLATGEVVIATFTSQGYKITLSNWALTGSTRIPYAWSSEVTNEGLERLHVRWDDSTLTTRIIELDTGWGYDGRVFKHYFDTAHLFNQNGSQMMSVEKCRLYGQGYGVATLDIKSSGIEDDFFQPYHDTVQDISMPTSPDVLYDRMLPVTSIVDQANYGLGIKLRIQGSNEENSTTTEPPHICQVLVLHVKTEGALDG